MKKYPKMKPSGVEWIGNVPEHWEVKKLKRLAKICNGQDHKNVWTEDGEYPILGTGGEFGRANSFLSVGPSVLLGRKGTIDKPQFIEHPFWSVDTAYFTEIYDFTDPKFFFYCCKTIQFDRYKYGSAVPSMTQETLNQIPFAAPSKSEQTTIAQYLDRKTAQADQAIYEKEGLIELFREERQAIINHAVTKGIRAGVKMKPSGVEWIGDVPEHWRMKRVKRVCKLQGRIGFKGYSKTDLVNEGEGVLTLGAKHISKKNELDLSSPEFLSWEKYYESPEIMVQQGHVIVTQRGSLGKVVVIDKDIGAATINPSMILLKDLSIDQHFFYYSFNGHFFTSWIEMVNNATAVPMISQEMLANLPIVCPDLAEQKEIVKYLNDKTAQIDTATSGIQQEITLLQEYRQALIFEAVTGKVDVRENT